jgi:hypothetical protein
MTAYFADVQEHTRTDEYQNRFADISEDSYPDPPALDPPPLPKFLPLGPNDPTMICGASFDKCCARFLIRIRESLDVAGYKWKPSSRFAVRLDSVSESRDGSSEVLQSRAFLFSLTHYTTMWGTPGDINAGAGSDEKDAFEIQQPLATFHILYLIRLAHVCALVHGEGSSLLDRRSRAGNVIASVLDLKWDLASHRSLAMQTHRSTVRALCSGWFG